MIKPLGSRVLIKKHVEEKKQGLIITTDKNEEKFQGIIEAKGNECSESVKVGDMVIYERYQGTLYEDTHLVLEEKFLVGIVIA